MIFHAWVRKSTSGCTSQDPESTALTLKQLEIGDVVFGSRSELFTADSIGSEKIAVGQGTMIANRVVLLPGTRVDRRTVMGFGALGSAAVHTRTALPG